MLVVMRRKRCSCEPMLIGSDVAKRCFFSETMLVAEILLVCATMLSCKTMFFGATMLFCQTALLCKTMIFLRNDNFLVKRCMCMPKAMLGGSDACCDATEAMLFRTNAYRRRCCKTILQNDASCEKMTFL